MTRPATPSGPSGRNYYVATATAARAFPELAGTREAEVCIVGGGFAGLNTALGLAERGVRGVVVLESHSLGHGASGRNGGFVFGGFSRSPADLLRELGAERARRLYAGTIEGIELIRSRIGRYAIDCRHVDAGVYWANWFRDPQVLHDCRDLMQRHFERDLAFIPRTEFRELVRSERYSDALFEAQAMHFQPLDYVHGIARAAVGQGVDLFERSPAIGLQRVASGWRVKTPDGEVDAKQVVLACGGYLAGLRRKVDAGVLPIATYVMVTESLGDRMRDILRTRAAIYDTRFAFDYYRPLPDNRLLWGGRISVLDRSPEAVRRLLRRDMLKVFPTLDDIGIEYAWSGLMSYARHEMPQIGQVEDGLWLAQAFGGHGVAPTTFAGEVLASAIAEGDIRWREFADYGLVSALKPAGFVGAQLTYWWLEAKDAWRAWREA
ncbi:NAD(P)/FAD-dependent oxidoreductase [Arenimonas sp.]|uniref:NAD(P)/FAD-dependent oxidoreductase n=1 Tax=Arenimonas sp. TaxID=1872635 RepID=UPI0039E45155